MASRDGGPIETYAIAQLIGSGVGRPSPASILDLSVTAGTQSGYLLKFGTYGTGNRAFTWRVDGPGSNYDTLYLAANTVSGGNTFANILMVQADGKIGIGTASPAFLLHIEKDVDSGLGPTLCLQNSTYANSDSAYSALRFQHVNTGRYSEIRGFAHGTYGQPYSILFGMTDANDTYHDIFKIFYNGTTVVQTDGIDGVSLTSITVGSYQIVTSGSPTIYGIGLSTQSGSRIYSGYTNAGYQMGYDCNMLRYDAGGSLDKGTLTSQYGIRILLGHYGSEGSKTTSNIYGINMPIYHQTGSFASYTGLYIVDGGGGSSIATKYHIYTDTYGACYRGSNLYWDASSDKRLKKNIKKYDVVAMDLIRQLSVVSYQWNGKGPHKHSDQDEVHIGLVADDLQDVFPRAIRKMGHITHVDHVLKKEMEARGETYPLDEDDGTQYLGYTMDEIYFTLLKAAQELDERLSKLEKKQ